MDKKQANTVADPLVDIERSKNPIEPPRHPASSRQLMTGLGAITGFGLAMVIGGLFLESTFPASLIGLTLGAIIGRYFGHYIAPPKA